MPHTVAFIGLGVMGQRMLGSMALSPHFSVLTAWDPDAGACERTRELYPDIRIAASAEEAIGAADTGVVYIACPPIWHREYATAAMAAGKAVYCEKPLGVDIAESRELVESARDAGVVNIVNFSLASAAAVREVEKRLGADQLGEITGIDVRVHFSQWPREWQVDAARLVELPATRRVHARGAVSLGLSQPAPLRRARAPPRLGPVPGRRRRRDPLGRRARGGRAAHHRRRQCRRRRARSRGVHHLGDASVLPHLRLEPALRE